ncbi:MAG TPA: cytochrome c peroxidase [Kofleriaceae bacterium]|nr:cytochrome c peroxidase [Kofleriaceae bacterium]
MSAAEIRLGIVGVGARVLGLLAGGLLAAGGAGCGDELEGDAAERAVAERGQAVLTDEPIPRVPNPPLASDLAALPGDLRAIAVPGPDLTEYVVDRQAAIALGKALFWDMQVGSDGIQACASCHFRAGADPRSKNQMSPGLRHWPEADLEFTTGGPNSKLRPSDFPLSRLAVPGVRGALDPSTDSNDVVSSQGVHHLRPGELDPLGFSIWFTNTRRVEPRNTPSVINAVFNHRQFWDGRAENVFNGVNHQGARDPGARVARADDPAAPALVAIGLVNSSLASQAVAPLLSDLEMAAPGTRMVDVARRVLRARPLARQLVRRDDSALGALSRAPLRGLSTPSYAAMIGRAFHRRWWDSSKLVQLRLDGSVAFVDAPDHDPLTAELTLAQYNFALFFGLAVQLYEATLVSDDTPWDRFRRQHPLASDPALNPWLNTAPDHISRQALFGAMLFNDRTRGPTNLRCSNCHEQAELTDASVRRISSAVNGPVRNRDGNVIDKGFNNIGVRPTTDDLGAGGSDALGPLSHTRRLFPLTPPASFDGAVVSKGFGVEGAFKIPSLRNVELTAPYFHNGDARTLREAVELYSRGGNLAPLAERDGTPIEPLGVPALAEPEIDALVAFLQALTDERVRYRKAPFDHPQLFVPSGHLGNDHLVFDFNLDGLADDLFVEIPAVGAAGGPALPGFLDGAQ